MLLGLRMRAYGTSQLGRVSSLRAQDDTASLIATAEKRRWEAGKEGNLNSNEGPARFKAPKGVRPGQSFVRPEDCPIHPGQSCECKLNRPQAVVRFCAEETGARATSKVGVDVSAKYPVAIDGPCEANSDIHIVDLSGAAGIAAPATVCEWKVAVNPGANPQWSQEAKHRGMQLRLPDDCVGKYVKLTVLRRLHKAEKHSVGWSTTQRGPVKVDDATTRAMLVCMAQTECKFEVQLSVQGVMALLDTPPEDSDALKRPIFMGRITVNRTGIVIEATIDKEYHRDWWWIECYATRPVPKNLANIVAVEAINEGQVAAQADAIQENVTLHLHLRS
eukprot:GHVT01097191.1.p1 GENE.GHVT01097191.1~~GHVT01097191.1.p1  ORF type:complete len:333 (+),score=32.39 GHVT01097191.1:510-1508(+)